jgi:two-component system nitrate/nitrite response regulator NarL
MEHLVKTRLVLQAGPLFGATPEANCPRACPFWSPKSPIGYTQQQPHMVGLSDPAILSGTATRAIAETALAAGAAGFLPKTIAAKSLIHAVRFMAAGEKYVPVKFMTERDEEKPNPLASKLTPRELEVLNGLVDGRSNKEIAKSLDLQEVTIKLHVKTLCRKLAARNRTHAAMIAKDMGTF